MAKIQLDGGSKGVKQTTVQDVALQAVVAGTQELAQLTLNAAKMLPLDAKPGHKATINFGKTIQVSARFFHEAFGKVDLSKVDANTLSSTQKKVFAIAEGLYQRLLKKGFEHSQVAEAIMEVAEPAWRIERELSGSIPRQRALLKSAFAAVKELVPNLPAGAVPVDVSHLNLHHAVGSVLSAAFGTGKPAYGVFNGTPIIAQPPAPKPGTQAFETARSRLFDDVVHEQNQSQGTTLGSKGIALVQEHRDVYARLRMLENDVRIKSLPAGNGERLLLEIEHHANATSTKVMMQALETLSSAKDVNAFVQAVMKRGVIADQNGGFSAPDWSFDPDYVYERTNINEPFRGATEAWEKALQDVKRA